MEKPAELEAIVRELLETIAGVDRSHIDSSTSMASLDLDSLSIVSIAAQCCMRLGQEMDPDGVLNLYDAEDFGEFVAAVRASIERGRGPR